MSFQPPYLTVVTADDFIFGIAASIVAFAGHHRANITAQNQGARVPSSQAGINLVNQRIDQHAQANPTLQAANAKQTVQATLTHILATVAKVNQQFPARKKCKGILDYQLRVRQRPVHFVLDGFNTYYAAKKLSYDPQNPAQSPPEQNKEADVTNAEIRWVYRHREDPDVSRFLQFWRAGGAGYVAVGPPWEPGNGAGIKEVGAWLQYNPGD